MVRWDKTEFFYDIGKHIADVPTFQCTEKTFNGGPLSPEDGGTFKIMVWKFLLPLPGTGTRVFVRLQDFKSMLDMKRADATDSQLIQRGWENWKTIYMETSESEQFP